MDIQRDSQQQPMGRLRSRRTLRLADRESIEKIYLYLGTYIQNPEAALHVEELHLDAGPWDSAACYSYGRGSITPTINTSTPSAEETAVHNQIVEYIRSLGLSEKTTEQMIESLEWKFNGEAPGDYYGHRSIKGYAGAAATILLSLCKDITHLHAYRLERAWHVRDFLVQNNYGRLSHPSLQRLRSVRIEAFWPDDERNYDAVEFFEHFRFFGRLPAIESYYANAVMAYQMNRKHAPPGTSNIRKIRITNADVDSGALGSIIRLPRALEEFTLSIGGLAHFKGGSPRMLIKTLGKCLLEHKDTLKVLDMDIHGVVSSWGDPDQEDGGNGHGDGDDDGERKGRPSPLHDEFFRIDKAEATRNGKPLWSRDLPDTRPYGYTMGSLHDFVALEMLAVPIAALLGHPQRYDMGGDDDQPAAVPPFKLVDGLPPNIKSLRLYDYHRGACGVHDLCVDELKEEMAERFPALVEVMGIDEPYVRNSQYGERAGYDEENPPPAVAERNRRFMQDRRGEDEGGW